MAKAPRADLIEKEPTPLQKRFIRYIKRETGYDVDVTTVVLFQSLRTPFQKSDENQADLEARRAAAAAKEAEAEQPKPAKKAPAKKAPAKKAAPAKRPAKKVAATKAAKPSQVEDEVEEDPFDDEE